MATANPLDQATRDSIIAQAKARAATSGKSAEQELYDYGTSQGFDAAGIDTAMGFGAGTTTGWAQKNVPNYQSSNSGILGSATPATPTPAAKSAPQPAAGNWGAMPTEADRTSIIAQANDKAKASGGNVTSEMVKYANGIGMPLDVAEQRMGYAPGTLSGNGILSSGTGGSTSQSPAMPAVNPSSLGLPATWTISPDQTVEGRINNLTDPNNPLIAQARSRALQTMNGRGLLNSSIAMGAADSAAYDAAIPIATADAANASKVAGYNTDEKNQFAIKNLDDATNRYNIDTNAGTQRYTANLSADTQLKIKQLDQTQQAQLTQLETQNRALIQNSSVASSAYDKYANTLYNNSVNKDMTPQARYQADLNAFNIYQQQIQLASKLMGVPDVSSLLDFTGIDPSAPPIDPATGKPTTPSSPANTNQTTQTGILNQPIDPSYYQR